MTKPNVEDAAITTTIRDISNVLGVVDSDNLTTQSTLDRFLDFKREKRALQQVALSTSLKHHNSPKLNSPARRQIVKGTVASLKSRFERRKSQELDIRSSPKIKRVIGLKKPYLEPVKSAQKQTLRKNLPRTRSAKKAVFLSHQPLIDDFIRGLDHQRLESDASNDDLGPADQDNGARKAI